MKQIKNKSIITIFLIISVLLTGVLGCTYGFPKGFDKDTCTTKAENIIEVINSKDYETLHSMIRSDLQENITAEDFAEAWDAKLDKIGAFKEYGNPVLSGEFDRNTGEEFAMVVYYCYYEDGEAIFTIYFDSDMEMTSISMKLD